MPLAATKASIGLGNVDNTSDTAKPVSTAQAAAIAGVQLHCVLLTSGTGWATPAGTTMATIFEIEMTAGGGGGGGSNGANAASSGGGSGERKRFLMTGKAAGTAITYAIGGAGAGGSTAGSDGGDGGDTSFNGVVCAGGKAGLGSTNASGATAREGGAGGSGGADGGTGNTLIEQCDGERGGRSFCNATTSNYCKGGDGGRSPWGSAGIGGSTSIAQNGTPSTGYGVGGSGGFLATTGGNAGRPGAIRIRWVA